MGQRLSNPYRARAVRRAWVVTTCLVLTLGAAMTPGAGAAPDRPVRQAPAAPAGVSVLVFHGAPDAQRDPVERAAQEIQRIGAQHGIGVETSSDPAVFSAENLAAHRAVVFLAADGVTLSGPQETALQNFMQSGGGFVGISDAARAQVDSDWFTGLIGTRPVGARPVPATVAEVTGTGESPDNEAADNAIDGDQNTKWLTFSPTGSLTMQLAEPAAITSYSLTSANDFPDRDPAGWTLQGSADGQTWTDLDSRTGETFADRFQTRDFEFDGTEFNNAEAYPQFRLDITANAGAESIQLADIELYTGDAEEAPEPQVERAVVNLTDRQHPANDGLPLNWTRSDRWQNWAPNPVGTVHTVAQVEERHYDAGDGANGPFHPISWCRDYEGGRSFYTGMGGTAGSYDEQNFQRHLLGALQWTTGMVRADCKATIAANYRIERLTAPNQEGELDQIGEPHGLAIADDGGVFYAGKAACPTGPVVDWADPNVGLGCGTIHRWDPASGEVALLTTLEVMGNRGSGDELVKNEEGLVGIELDPNFTENGWIYAFWMPHESIDRENRVGQRTVSRFTYDPAAQSIDQATRVDLLSWDTQIHSCCHAGGGMAFDAQGNLYIGSGDNNSSQGSDGYSGNNWTQAYAGISFQDARRTSGNTNDLNGKILRIHPEPDGTYTVPDGNLFPEAADPADKTLPEIYVMGVRNISRLAIDPVTNWLTAGWVGPDASSPSPELGPAKYDTATIITEAGNQGWPYCMGNRQPYRDRSNTDAEVLTGWYDCDRPQNTSPRNTGLVDLPPVRDNMIWYAPDGGGPVFPDRLDGTGVPTYDAEDATYTQPYLRGGGQAIMSGPTYHPELVNPNSRVAWPEYWDNKWFIGDQSNPENRVAVTVDPSGVQRGAPPAFGETLRQIVPTGSGPEQLQSWMDAEFGPDGALYLLDYAGGFFSLDDNQKLIRVVYEGGEATPAPAATSVAVQNKPLTYQFTGARSGGRFYEWDFGDGTTSTEMNPRHTYARAGIYTAGLTVTYADGERASTRASVFVGCTVPDTGPTVTFDDVNTTVPNRQTGGGCTIDDLIDDESSWPSNAAFVEHVAAVADGLVRFGIVNEDERGTLNAAAAASPIGTEGHTGYEPLFDGTAESLLGWSQAPSGSFAIQEDGSLRSQGGLGMLWYDERPFRNFSLTLQFRDMAPDDVRSNSGVFVRFPNPDIPLEQRPPGCGTVGSARTSPAWVAIYCGHEIQMYDGESGEPQKTGSIYNFDPVGLDEAGPTAKGTWNTYEVRVVGQRYTIVRNGVVINEFDNTPGIESSREGDPSTDLRQFVNGFIGLQNHGTNDLTEFRNVRVRELPTTPAPAGVPQLSWEE